VCVDLGWTETFRVRQNFGWRKFCELILAYLSRSGGFKNKHYSHFKRMWELAAKFEGERKLHIRHYVHESIPAPDAVKAEVYQHESNPLLRVKIYVTHPYVWP
jgi:hypothetical protein